jgi:hypothetical protein
MKRDGRKLDHRTLEEIRRMAPWINQRQLSFHLALSRMTASKILDRRLRVGTSWSGGPDYAVRCDKNRWSCWRDRALGFRIEPDLDPAAIRWPVWRENADLPITPTLGNQPVKLQRRGIADLNRLHAHDSASTGRLKRETISAWLKPSIRLAISSASSASWA